MSSPLTRNEMLTVFSEDELMLPSEELLGEIPDVDSREVLRTLGLPVWENPWFDMDDEVSERLQSVAGWDVGLSDRFDEIPQGAERWISLGTIPYDDIAFDASTGVVYCLSDESGIYPFNSSLRNFIHFLYLLQSERPKFDIEHPRYEQEGEDDPEMTRRRVKDAMEEIDPAALENPDSRWHEVLDYIVDSELHY
ncbi:SUKH-4 family immunity protein [Streptomyces sp. NPDC059897]|uniref:SUKH-4 family immunity protein n=1 Tax=Streptomyces sp. NPDC059897 TaxID=3346994 RepID=UPI003653A37C